MIAAHCPACMHVCHCQPTSMGYVNWIMTSKTKRPLAQEISFLQDNCIHEERNHSFYFALQANYVPKLNVICRDTISSMAHLLTSHHRPTYIYIYAGARCWNRHIHILAWIIDSGATVIYVPAGVTLKQKQKKSVLKIKNMHDSSKKKISRSNMESWLSWSSKELSNQCYLLVTCN